jgi:pimeloyl-ACP methyl ester carboxylesterase
MPKKRLRDMVVLLPGITGSVLQKNGRDVWALSGQAVWGALTSMGASFQDLLLKDDDPDLDDLGDGVRATRLMPDVHFIPGLVKIDGYTETVRLIKDNFEVRPGSLEGASAANFFEFPYDWRRDNRVAARQLKQLIDRQLPIWRQSSGADDAKVIFIAHSMGGLIARYYLEVLEGEGWRNCRALITFGTPYRGSLNALNFLANGYKQLFVDLTEVMRSFTAVYQLLPIYKAVKVDGSSGYQRVAEIDDIPGLVRAHAEQALTFHRKIETAVNEHRKDIEYLQRGYTILPIVGTRQPTYQSASLAGGRLTVDRALPSWIDTLLSDGDGTVPMLSAIPIELSEQYQDTFFPERHGSLQRNAIVLDNLRPRLERMQVEGLGKVRGPEISPDVAKHAAISLDLDDLYLAKGPVELRAQLVNVSATVGPPEAYVQSVDGAASVAVTKQFQPEGSGWVLRVEGLPASLYRVEVRTAQAGPGAPPPVHDLFEVAG